MRQLRSRMFWPVFAVGVVTGALAAAWFQAQPLSAQTGDGNASTDNTGVNAELEELWAAIEELQDGLVATDDTLKYMRVETGPVNGLAGPHVVFEGCNLHVRSGSGQTSDGGALTGLGNLIIGYNEAEMHAAGRGGAHNLVIGRDHTYTNYGGLVAGVANTISGRSASVTGGAANVAGGRFATVCGGVENEASGNASAVIGGAGNKASGNQATVSGGGGNQASGSYATVSGGGGNQASGDLSAISAGAGNTASGLYASVTGGDDNTASGEYSTISAGTFNEASGDFATVSGGGYNAAAHLGSTVSGNWNQSTSSDYEHLP